MLLTLPRIYKFISAVCTSSPTFSSTSFYHVLCITHMSLYKNRPVVSVVLHLLKRFQRLQSLAVISFIASFSSFSHTEVFWAFSSDSFTRPFFTCLTSITVFLPAYLTVTIARYCLVSFFSFFSLNLNLVNVFACFAWRVATDMKLV